MPKCVLSEQRGATAPQRVHTARTSRTQEPSCIPDLPWGVLSVYLRMASTPIAVSSSVNARYNVYIPWPAVTSMTWPVMLSFSASMTVVSSLPPS